MDVDVYEDGFPIGTSGGGDFLTGLPARDVQVTTPGGGEDVRPERVVMTAKHVVYGDPPTPPGRIGFSELTIRTLASAVGMVSCDTVAMLNNIVARLTGERDDLSERLAGALREVESLRDSTDPRVIYVAPDGTEHASRGALLAHIGRGKK